MCRARAFLANLIEKRIKESEEKAEENLKLAQISESDAISLEKHECWDKAGRKFHNAADQYFRSCVHLESIDLWITGLQEGILKELNLRKSDERYLSYHKKTQEYHKRSAGLYKKASDIYGKLKNKFLSADLLGKATREYFRVFELSNEKELKIEMEPGKVYSFSDTQVGTIVALYRAAANLFNDIGIEFEEAGKKSKAYIFYGYMGDAYLSIALAREKDKYWPFGVPSDQAENYLCAAEAYRKSGELSKEVGVSRVVAYARIAWKHAHQDIFAFFKDEEGYTTSDDSRRAILAYRKANEVYGELGMKPQADYCAHKIDEIKEALETLPKEIQRKLGLKGKEMTGYAWADTTCSTVISEVKKFILPSDLEDYQVVIACLLNYMGQNLQNNFFKGEEHNEASFHEDLSKLLKSKASIGADALNEVYIGGGRVDILARDIPIELKVEKEVANANEVIARHMSQASHYAASQGKAVGVLCVLDLTEKKMPIPDPRNDVRVVRVPVHGYEKEELTIPSMIVALIIRGNLPQPSGLS